MDFRSFLQCAAGLRPREQPDGLEPRPRAQGPPSGCAPFAARSRQLEFLSVSGFTGPLALQGAAYPGEVVAGTLFVGCAVREIYRSIVAPPGYEFPAPISIPYLGVVLVLATLFAWPPIHVWHFQRFLSTRATELAENHRAQVHCNSAVDTMLDPMMLSIGHANPLTGEIGIQAPW